MPGQVIAINGLFNVVSDFKYLPFIAAGLWLLAGLLWIGEAKIWKNFKDNQIACRIWLAFAFISFLILGRMLYCVNILGQVERYGSLQQYLLFDNEWGTHRGYIWKLAMKIYEDFPMIHKIFGYGPDTFGIITVHNFYEEMVTLYGRNLKMFIMNIFNIW